MGLAKTCSHGAGLSIRAFRHRIEAGRLPIKDYFVTASSAFCAASFTGEIAQCVELLSKDAAPQALQALIACHSSIPLAR